MPHDRSGNGDDPGCNSLSTPLKARWRREWVTTCVNLATVPSARDSVSKEKTALKAIEKALALLRSVQTLEGTDKDGIERLLEIAADNLKQQQQP